MAEPMPGEGPARVWTGAREAAVTVRKWPPETGGHALEVTIIRPGRSGNGLFYTEEALRQSVPLWEGAAAFCDHPTALDETRAGGRSVRDLVGVYCDARYEDGVRATLRLYPNAGWLFEVARAALADAEAGRPAPKIGISADMRVLKERRGDGWEVRRITKVVSGDVVFQPAAGGKFERVLEGGGLVIPSRREESPTASSTGILPVSSPAAYKSQILRAERPVVAALPADPPLRGTGSPRRGDGMSDKEVDLETIGTVEAAQEAQMELERAREMRRALEVERLEARLASSGLPEAARASVRRRLEGRAFEANEVEQEIADMRQVVGQTLQAGVVRGVGQTRVQMGADPRERIQMAMDRLFGLEVADPGVPRLTGIREAYLLITGDRQFRGVYNWEESVVREANEVTTSVMSDVLLNSLTKRLVKDYEAQPRWWRPIVRVASIRDVREQNRILLNDFAALSTVSENGAYNNLAWGDTRENYTPAKRGNLVVVTLEAILNDDLHSITRIPAKLAAAAAVTLNEFVSGLFTANSGAGPAMADTYYVFDATNHQGNAGTTALSSAALQAATIAMLKYTNSASKRLGVRPRYLLGPPDLAFTAQVITESALAPGGSNNDINPLRGAVQPIVVPQWTDTNNWYLMADPAVVEGIELGFLNGQEAPELLAQDHPAAGSVFTNDAISYKVRHIFGGGWLDYRAGFGSIVA